MEALKIADDFLLDDATEAELDEAIDIADDCGSDPYPPFDQWEPSDEDEAKVDRYLRALRYYRAERDKVAAAAQAERERIDEWERKHARKPDGAIAYLETVLRLFSEAVGKKKRVSPSGTLSWRKGRERVVVEDVDAFCARHAGSDLVRTKAEPDKSTIIARVKAGGEIPEGADIQRGDDTFVIDVEA